MKAEYLKLHFKGELERAISEIKETYDKWGNLIYTAANIEHTNRKELIKQLRENLEAEYKNRYAR